MDQSGSSLRSLALLPTLFMVLSLPSTGASQDRVTPKESRGGKPPQELWADIAEEFRSLKFPEWKLPAEGQAAFVTINARPQ